MLKSRIWLYVIITLLSLSACKKDDTSVTIDASDVQAASSSATSAAETPVTQTLTSKDDKLSIVVNGSFADVMDSATDWVDQEELNSLTLLQHDENSNITLAVNNLGTIKIKPDEYFKNLADSLQNNKNISDIKVGVATENRMNYRFSHQQNGSLLNESCVALIGDNNLYSVCASSESADYAELAGTLKTINVQNS
ncbi:MULTISPECIES: cytochrome C [Snodgrassella]|uniref:cytochrome C n=1 Tax=Snodgrassella TaxID=1193515 RepID=UPI0015828F78|nr:MULTISPECIES: cytochrome C [unclassified Snodgrassella]MBI0067216.1 cytochrome C [Snodgrassella sp. M0110]MBI0075866.1 cytochrome C [Snodgrassella sp. M0118]MBI0078517.1 cytochrome C [Snodgrassella sp. M0112]NUF78808.1 cytochrome C [Snodgrassella sp. ESL0323]